MLRAITVLALAVLMAGCPKQGAAKYRPEDLENNPAANFQSGLDLVQRPDKKTGAVDYVTAYDRFNKAANLGAGPKASFNAGWVAE
jgi:PBP1b-binding outer membrane lipoprotein LpoB